MAVIRLPLRGRDGSLVAPKRAAMNRGGTTAPPTCAFETLWIRECEAGWRRSLDGKERCAAIRDSISLVSDRGAMS